MFKRLIASLVCLTFSFSNLQYVQAQDFSVNQLPVPGTMIGESVPFAPLALKGLIVNPQKPLEFQFIVDTGKGPQDATLIKDQANQMVKYFLAGLTIPEGDLWVNLSPYEKNRMVPEALGQTDLGRDLLAQDYILKQLTASLIYPEKDLGKKFWSRVYAKAQQQFGTTNVPVNTFNKVWILPDQAQVYENVNAAYVTKSTLKVMLDEDYTALQKHISVRNGTDSIGSQIVRQIILPEIEKEVNTGKNFAPLRQIYQALILAKWYKETIQNGLLDALYTNKNKVAGVNLNDPIVKEQIYERYLKAYKKGAFNYIKEDPTPDGQVVPRKYFSGGFKWKVTLRRDGAMSAVRKIGSLFLLIVGLGSIANLASAKSNTSSQTYPTTGTIQPEVADVNTKDMYGSTPLMKASHEGNMELVNQLLAKGADINGKGYNDQTALMYAVRNVQKDVVEQLLAKGADVNAKNRDGSTALILASKILTSDWMAVRSAIELDKDVEKIVKLLLTKGADVNAKNNNGETALMMLSQGAKKELVELLLAKGADVNAKDKDGHTALWVAHDYNFPEYQRQGMHDVVIRYLDTIKILEAAIAEKNGLFQIPSVQTELLSGKSLVDSVDKYGRTPLMVASIEGNTELVKQLLAKGADVNAKDRTGETALIKASDGGHKEVVELLITKGADVNVMDNADDTALSLIVPRISSGGSGWTRFPLERGGKDILKIAFILRTAGAKNSERMEHVDIPGGAGETELMKASVEGNVELVKQLLAKGADVNAKTDDSDTALTLASLIGNKDIVEQLLVKGADINAKTEKGRTALFFASDFGNEDIVRLLLAKGADVNTKDNDGKTTLLEASENGYSDIVAQLLIAKGVDVNAIDEKSGWTALIEAALNVHEDIVKQLLAKGADVNAKDFNGHTVLSLIKRRKDLWGDDALKNFTDLLVAAGAVEDTVPDTTVGLTMGPGTALMKASWEGNIGLVKQLLANGANVNERNTDGTALIYASLMGHKDVVELLLANGVDVNQIAGSTDERALMSASLNGHKDIVALLIDKGADVNARNSFYGTALVYATRGGHKDVVQLLLAQGADVNVIDTWRRTALTIARENNYEDIVEMLKTAGAKEVPPIHTDSGVLEELASTPLMEASKNGDMVVVRQLLAKGADINEKGVWNRTALMYASMSGHKDIVQFLITEGADVNAKDSLGETALMKTTDSGYKEIVELLIAKGTDVNAKDEDGWTALITASLRGHKDIVELLLAKGADVNASNKYNATALSLARERGYQDIVKILTDHGAKDKAMIRQTLNNLATGMLAATLLAGPVANQVLAQQDNMPLQTSATLLEINRLIAELNSSDQKEQASALDGLIGIGKPAIPELKNRLLSSIQNKDRLSLLYAYKQIGGNLEDIVPIINNLLHSSNGEIVFSTLVLLNSSYLGPKFEVIAPEIQKIMNRSNSNKYGGHLKHIGAFFQDLFRYKQTVINPPEFVQGPAFREGPLDMKLGDLNYNIQDTSLSVDYKIDLDPKAPLVRASEVGDKFAVERLLAQGADVNVKDVEGFPSLYYAYSKQHYDVMEILLKVKGIDVNGKDELGQTALISASYYGVQNIVGLLLAQGADINARDKYGFSALMSASVKGSNEVVNLLLTNGADINAENNDGYTALMLAARDGHKDIVVALLAKGAHVNELSDVVDTALSLARKNGHQDVVDILKAHGAKDTPDEEMLQRLYDRLRSKLRQSHQSSLNKPSKIGSIVNIRTPELPGVGLQSPTPNILPQDIIDKVLAKNGGIDLNKINVKRNGKTVNVQFDPAQLIQLQQGGFEGFSFKIESMARISSPFQLLGINAPTKQMMLVKA